MTGFGVSFVKECMSLLRTCFRVRPGTHCLS